MNKQLNFMTDLYYLPTLLAGEYEKANIWPNYKSIDEAAEILEEEVNEAITELKVIKNIMLAYKNKDVDLSKENISDIRGHAQRLMCESIQIVASCNKADRVHDREEDDSNV